MNRFNFYLLVCLVSGSCNQTYKVTTDSMSNTFNVGQVIVLKDKAPLDRGDVVLFSKTNSSGQGKETWLSRVIAFSGDSVRIKDGNVMVNNKMMELPENARLLYLINTSSPLDLKQFRNNMVKQIAENKYIAFLSMDEYSKVSEWSHVDSISRIISGADKNSKGIVRKDYSDK